MTVNSLNAVVTELADRYGEEGAEAGETLAMWAEGRVPLVHRDSLADFYQNAPLKLVFDSFWRIVPFGTGGRRGPVGFGPNRINETTLALTIQGHCNYLRKRYPDREIAVVVANDVRHFQDIAGVYGEFWPDNLNPLLAISSPSLALLAARIYAANGIIAYLKSPGNPYSLLTTPELSFAIRFLGAAGGVNMSASHNHPDDNGIKIYDEHGAQFAAPEDEVLVAEMVAPGDVAPLSLSYALQSSLIRPIPAEVHEGYIDLYVKQFRHWCPHTRSQGSRPFVYTPLCGSGMTSVGDVLNAIGFWYQVPSTQGPDPAFTDIPFRAPNPEVVEATAKAKEFADRIGAPLVLSSDPDADRVGVDVRVVGGWRHLTGNEIAAVLAYFLMLDPEGPRLNGAVLTTIVTSRLVSAIAREAGSKQVIDDLRVGFKNHANVLREFEQAGAFNEILGIVDDVILAAEESHGVLSTPRIRDKDAVSAIIYFACLQERLSASGRTLVDYLEEIQNRFPGYAEMGRSIVLLGSEGVADIDGLMESLRSTPPSHLGDHRVQRVNDYWDTESHGEFLSESDRLSRNLIQYTAGNVIVTVRPSGTEPKIKFYVHVLPKTDRTAGAAVGNNGAARSDATDQADAIAKDVYRLLLSRLGKSLSDEALLLPDIATLEAKMAFDEVMVPTLLQAIQDGTPADEILPLLESLGRVLTPGSNPLPGLKTPLQEALRRSKAAGQVESRQIGPVLQALEAL